MTSSIGSTLSSLMNTYCDNVISTATTSTTSATTTGSTGSTSTTDSTTTSTDKLKSEILLKSKQMDLQVLNIMAGKASYSNTSSSLDDYADISDEAQSLYKSITEN